MKKSNLKKAFALSALMAFVITGSAYAADFTVNAGEEKLMYQQSMWVQMTLPTTVQLLLKTA